MFVSQKVVAVMTTYSYSYQCYEILLVFNLFFGIILSCSPASAPIRRYHFRVAFTPMTRLCNTRQVLTVNGQYPGPTIAVNEGDRLEIKVTNDAPVNTTLHWHGIRQMRTGWYDGPAYITQCPIRGGQSYTYKFRVKNQRGTLWWHAHYSWQRAFVHGAFIIYPRRPYPFSRKFKIHAEIPVILGEWWNCDPMAAEDELILWGGGPKVSAAYMINGHPGPLYNCSLNDTFVQTVEQGKTYMLRIVNAVLNQELFFTVANHTLTVVEIDASYTKPFATPAIMIAPGQTTNVLLTADRVPHESGMFPMAAAPYVTSIFPFNNSTTIGFLRSKTSKDNETGLHKPSPSLRVPNLCQITDTDFATKLDTRLRSLNTHRYPCRVPKTIDKRIIATVSLNLQDCPANKTCKGLDGKRFLASMNNQSFVLPSRSILDIHYNEVTPCNFTDSFPERPPNMFNFTGVDPLKLNMNAEYGTNVLTIPFGTNVEIVLQDTGFLNIENHPIHFHGYNFFIVGTGFGNFDVDKDPKSYNLNDPPERNTVAVPSGGWAAIRFKADNPGVWFVHCHIEAHTTWGLSMAFVVPDGPRPKEKLLPPPKDLPSC